MKKTKRILIGLLTCLTMIGLAACGVGSGGNQEEISSEKHIHSYAEEITKEATCVEVGVKTFTCDCGDGYTEKIPVLGHEYENYICIRCEGEIKPSEGLEYELNSDGKSYSVVGLGACTDADLVIPFTYNNFPVTNIGEWAFSSCRSLTSVMLPDSVTSIGDRAFLYCHSLTSVVIPDNVTSIGAAAFEYCDSLTSVEIHSGSIGEDAFEDCDSLTSVVIGDGVTSIGEWAFGGCDSLTSVYYTGDIANWCAIEFEGATSNPLSYGAGLYINNTLVTELIIPDNVTSIGDYAFRGCESLTSVVIGDGVTSIGDRAFSSCDGLTSITFNGTTEQWDAIPKGDYWKYRVPATEVVCSDGNVAI